MNTVQQLVELLTRESWKRCQMKLKSKEYLILFRFDGGFHRVVLRQDGAFFLYKVNGYHTYASLLPEHVVLFMNDHGVSVKDLDKTMLDYANESSVAPLLRCPACSASLPAHNHA